MSSNLDAKKSGDVASLAGRLSRVVECNVCAIGIAISIIEHYFDQAEYDWQGKRFGHECRAAVSGLSPAEQRAVEEIEREYCGRQAA